MQEYFTNQSCSPFTDRSVPCKLGNYVSYSVKATGPADVVAALAFAQKNNLRVLARNTGHDFLGRSTGAGALAIWTQNLKSITFGTWKDKNYSGPSVTVGAGVIGNELIEAANAQGMSVVSGECATVGLAGGFTQGGGHSVLSTQFGLAADQTLSFEVWLYQSIVYLRSILTRLVRLSPPMERSSLPRLLRIRTFTGLSVVEVAVPTVL